jgi:hypothetical protein
VVDVHGAIPRIENGRDVPALIVILRRPAFTAMRELA